MHFWFIFEWDVGPHWDKHISRMARTEIRINDLFADRKKGVQSKDRGFATSPSGSRAGLSPQTNFQSNKKLLWFYKKCLQKSFHNLTTVSSMLSFLAGGGGGRGANTHQTHEMTVPNEIIGCVIGKGGSKIAEIRCTSKTIGLPC